MMANTKMRIMLTGKDGQIGWELRQSLSPLGELVAFGRHELDLAQPSAIREMVRAIKPTIIVNAAAYTAVDRAEEERDLAMAINGDAPAVLAEEAKRLGAGVIHFSTDYVFDGAKTTPYSEDDIPSPLNWYGHSKLAGEQALQATGASHLILRTSWVYGMRGQNFLLTILRLARERTELMVVDDQVGSPTWSHEVAEATAKILLRFSRAKDETGGVYHLTSSGHTTWYGFAKSIIALDQKRTQHICKHLKPIATCEYPTPARRPAYSVLSNRKLHDVFGVVLPSWEQGLESALL